ncbi:MAG: NTP transferase domain-containing protein [Acidobacteria bacterium]|nr:NTP transferase domain-containing protein [Acidobacteriota bacterium]
MAHSIDTALILAGGFGTRLRGLFPDLPKVLAPILSRPFLEWQIHSLRHSGIRRLVLCLGHRATAVLDYVHARPADGLAIEFSIESEPLGTAGAIRLAAPWLSAPALVLNGDTFLPSGYLELIQPHVAAQPAPLATMALSRMDDTRRYGSVRLSPESSVLSFHEKSTAGAALPSPGLVSAGAYVLDRSILPFIAPSGPSSIESDVFPAILAAGARILGATTSQPFFDMGTPEGHHSLERFLQDHGQ